MKEIEKDFFEKDDVVIEEKIPVSFRKLGRFRRKIKNGHIFEFNLKTNEMKFAQYSQTETHGENSKITINKDCAYIEALNMKNAHERLRKRKILFKT